MTLTYDAGTYGKGRRTGASDANHSMSWVYDALGRVTSKAQTVGTVAKTVGYAYTNGNLTTLATPSGQSVVYGYNANNQVVSITVNSTTLLSGVTYEPFGPAKGWTWGNGTASSRTFDTDGKVTAVASAGNKTYAFDDAFRITGITDTVTPANSYTYGYSNLDRLTSAVKTGTTRGWTYDANGNRVSETGASPSTYTISSANNRISSISGSVARTYTYNAVGSALTYSNITATYNHHGRMTTLKKASTTATFVYNALDQLVKRSGGTPGTVLYVYDEAGHLLGEYNSTGGLVQETIWLGDTPVATLRPGTPVGIFYVHTDHLNTPRKVTRPSDNKARWTWESDPFGTATPNENPQSLGTFKYNLRFPGQIYDSHGGLMQNYFRDYDPAIGRYVESDPIGLAGGVNSYLYASANPLVRIDPLGLTTLSLDVASGMLTVDPQEGDVVPYEVAVTSGKGQCTNDTSCEQKTSEGPIPRGQYYLNLSEVTNPNAFGDVLRTLRQGHDWGDWRVPLHPVPGTNTFKRDGFYLHGGMFSGSAGCIDVGGGLWGNRITEMVIRDLLNDPDSYVPLYVK